MKRAELAKLAKRVGVLVMDQGDAISVDAPVGYVIAATGVHSTTINVSGWTRPELYAELALDLRHGIEECPDRSIGCDACDEAMGFDELLELYRGERIG